MRDSYKPNAVIPGNLQALTTAIVWNIENFWSIDRQRQTYQWDTWNFPLKYLEIAKSLGAPVDIINENADLSLYRTVIIPAYEMVDSVLINKWIQYVSKGGHLIITCRTGVKNRMGHFWEGETAAPMINLVGARIEATDMLSQQVKGEVLMNQKYYTWSEWADLLTPELNTEIIATYSNQFYVGKAAVTKRKIGHGTILYIGVSTQDAKLEKDILQQVYAMAGASTKNYPPGVYVYWRDGFYFAVNYSSDNYLMSIPDKAKILVGETMIKPAGVLVWKED